MVFLLLFYFYFLFNLNALNMQLGEGAILNLKVHLEPKKRGQ